MLRCYTRCSPNETFHREVDDSARDHTASSTSRAAISALCSSQRVAAGIYITRGAAGSIFGILFGAVTVYVGCAPD